MSGGPGKVAPVKEPLSLLERIAPEAFHIHSCFCLAARQPMTADATILYCTCSSLLLRGSGLAWVLVPATAAAALCTLIMLGLDVATMPGCLTAHGPP